MMKIEEQLSGGVTKPSASVVKQLVKEGISRATWKRAQDAAHKEGKLKYIKKGRRTDWKWFGAESESESADQWDSDSHD
jgi:hypothetical protein